MTEWQPIATAPKDGSVILLTAGYKATGGGWISMGAWMKRLHADGHDWHNIAGIYVIHPSYWMSLPEPPK